MAQKVAHGEIPPPRFRVCHAASGLKARPNVRLRAYPVSVGCLAMPDDLFEPKRRLLVSPNGRQE